MFQVILPQANAPSVTRDYMGSRVLPVCFFWGRYLWLSVCLSLHLPACLITHSCPIGSQRRCGCLWRARHPRTTGKEHFPPALPSPAQEILVEPFPWSGLQPVEETPMSHWHVSGWGESS